MKQIDQWICWREEPNPGKKKPKKVPFSPITGKRLDPMDPAGWMPYESAKLLGHKLGFVFTEQIKYFFFDLDGCIGADGQCRPDAAALVQRFPGAMVELSHSRNGLHVVGKYTGERPVHGVRNDPLGLELYTGGRFMALGTGAQGDTELDCSVALRGLVVQHFPPKDPGNGMNWTDAPRGDWTGHLDDAKLIKAARKAGNAASLFGGSCPFDALWTNNADILPSFYPDAERAWNRSSSDLALARHLAFWTGNDCERVLRLMWESDAKRDKWAERGGWLRNTVLGAVRSCDKVYDSPQGPSAPPPVSVQLPDAPGATRDGYQFLAIPEQQKLFAGCIYVTSHHAVMTADGRMLKPGAFNAIMPTYDFARSLEASPKTTKRPWEAFCESSGYNQPTADESTFDPTAQWSEVIERGGRRYANTYRPIVTPCKEGDPGQFLAHLAKLLPDENDRAILLAFMAAVVQHKGIKFQWAPVLQGVEGNGKTMITSVLREAIGDGHFHSPQAHDLDNTFNAWLSGNILIGVEDISISSGRRQILEILKPMITNAVGGTTRKMVDAETSRICANFIFNSNHRDALIKTENDRRFAVFFTSQQRKSDLDRDGMGGDYFPKLYNWLRAEGYAICHHYLANYTIPAELNPANGWIAPETSSHHEAIRESLGPIEQRVIDWVEENKPGFCEPWVSRSMLGSALDGIKASLSIGQQRKVLERIGYIRHPAGGRTNNRVMPDGRPAELWVRPGHMAAQLVRMCMVEKNYTETNGVLHERIK